MAPTLYQKWAWTNYVFFSFSFFWQNLNISRSSESSDHTFLFKLHQHVANASKGMYGETSFTIEVFYVTIADADIESLGLPIHSLISICTLYHTMVCEQKSYNPNYTKF